jgi:acetyl esterase/lipase
MELDYSRIDPELLPGLEAFPALQITRDNVVALRNAMLANRAEPVDLPITREAKDIPSEDGAVPVIIYRKSERARQPAVLWIHGGGYLLGSAEDDRARRIAHELDCTVVSVDYRLAPEHPFPAGLNDCLAAYRWMQASGEGLGINTSRVAIGGASAGGGLAAGLALKLRDLGEPLPALQLLLYPMIDNLHDTPSGQYSNHPVWPQATSFAAWEMYLDGTPGLEASIYAAATRAHDLKGSPPAYLCVGTEDLFYDEDVQYAARLSQAGIPCELAVFPGLYHGADSFMFEAKVSQRLHRSLINALRDALEG